MHYAKKMIAALLASVVAVTSVPVMTSAATIEMGTKPEDGTTAEQPFAKGTGGSQNFRIPGLVTLNDGTLVASCDARWNHTGDACGLDTIVSHSTDNGETWNYTFANYLGDYGNKKHSHSSAFIDPSIATDGETVYMIADVWPGSYAINTAPRGPLAGHEFDEDGNLLLSNNNRESYDYHLERNPDAAESDEDYYVIKKNETGEIVEGYAVDAYLNVKGDGIDSNLFYSDQAGAPFLVFPTDYLYLTKSTDGGATWSIPSLLRMKKPAEKTLLIGPGRGIVTSTGRIVFTAYEYTDGDKNSACIYSDDGGINWERGASVPQQSSEAAIVEADGRLYIFTRHGGYNVSEDWGETWSECKNVGANYYTGCELSAITYSKKINGKTAIILSAPTNARNDGKLFLGLVNEDGTISWEKNYNVNEGIKYAYSCLTELKDGSIGLLYETTDDDIVYTNIPIESLAGADAAYGIWCEDENGGKKIAVELEPESDATYTLHSPLQNPTWTVTLDGDGEWIDADISQDELYIYSNALASGSKKEILTISDGTNTLDFTVVVNAQKTYPVKLRMEDRKVVLFAENGELDDSELDESIATVTEGADRWFVTGVSEGTTYLTEGNRTYEIIVKNDVKEYNLEEGESVIVLDRLPVEDLEKDILSIEKNTAPYPYGKVEEVAAGAYLIGKDSLVMANTAADATTNTGMKLESADFNTADFTDYLWTISETEGGYTIQDQNGKYLHFAGGKGEECGITLSDEPQVLKITVSAGGLFLISYGETIEGKNYEHYLNQLGGGTSRNAAGWHQNNDKWYLYQTAESYVITGEQEGKASIVVGGTTYKFTVGNPQVFEDIDDKMTEIEELLNQSDLTEKYTETSIAELRQKYTDAVKAMQSTGAKDVEDIQAILEELKAAMVLEEKKTDSGNGGNGGNEPGGNPPGGGGSSEDPGSGGGGKQEPAIPTIGDPCVDSGSTYHFLTADQTGGTVSYAGAEKKTAGSADVPDEITVDGRTYKVTKIEDSAFKGYKKLKKITIGANVEEIGKSAFQGCKKLKTISIKSQALKIVGKKALTGIHKKCTIKVPKKKMAAYKKLLKKKGLTSSMKIKKL